MGCKGKLNGWSSAIPPRFNRNIMGCKEINEYVSSSACVFDLIGT